ncbi:MAG TPA: phosphopantetheine-binding protein, partial [Pyrinomonadaceae bacterium]
ERGEYGEGDLERIGYTSQVGREALEARLGVVAGSLEELRRKLSAFLNGDKREIDGLYLGNVRSDTEDISSSSTADAGTVIRLLEERRLEGLAALWVQGVEVDWSLLYADKRPRRISLPTYPFEARRFWLPKYKGSEPEADAHPTTVAAVQNGDTDVEATEAGKEEIAGATAEASSGGKRLTLLPPSEAARQAHEAQGQAPRRAKLKLDALAHSPATETNVTTEFKGLRSDNGQAAGDGRAKVAASVSGRNGEGGSTSEREVWTWLRQSLAAVLYLEDEDIDSQSKFLDLGLDSVVGVEWAKEINQRFRTSLSADTVYKYPDLNSLSRHLLALLGDGDEQVPAAAPQEESAAPPVEERRSPAPAEQDAARLYTVLRDTLAGALYMEPEEVSADKSFMDFGLDSVVAVEWTRQLKKTLGVELAASDIYEHPTIRSLAAHLANGLTPAGPDVEPGGSESLDDLIEAVRSQRLSAEDAVRLFGEIFVPPGNGSD